VFCYLAAEKLGFKGKSIAEYLSISAAAVSIAMKKGKEAVAMWGIGLEEVVDFL